MAGFYERGSGSSGTIKARVLTAERLWGSEAWLNFTVKGNRKWKWNQMNKIGSSKVPGGNKTVRLTTDFTEQGAAGTSWTDSVGCSDLVEGLCDLGTGVWAWVRSWISELPRTTRGGGGVCAGAPLPPAPSHRYTTGNKSQFHDVCSMVVTLRLGVWHASKVSQLVKNYTPLVNLKIYHCVQTSPQLDPILRQFKPTHVCKPYLRPILISGSHLSLDL